MHAQIAQIALDRKVLQIAVAAEQLQRLVADVEPGIGREALGHRAMHGRLADRRGRGCAAPRQTISRAASSSVAMSASLNCNAWNSASGLAELAAFEQIGARRLETGARAAQRAGGDIEPPAVEPHHRDLEAVALGAEPVGDRHPAILEDHHRGRLRCSSRAFFSFLPKERPGVPFSTTRHEMPFGPCAAGPHHRDIDVADAAARDERLGAVQHVVVAVAHGAGGERRRVRAAARLGQAIAGEMLHAHQLGQKPRALLARCRSGRSSTPPCCGSTDRPRSTRRRRPVPRR